MLSIVHVSLLLLRQFVHNAPRVKRIWNDLIEIQGITNSFLLCLICYTLYVLWSSQFFLHRNLSLYKASLFVVKGKKMYASIVLN